MPAVMFGKTAPVCAGVTPTGHLQQLLLIAMVPWPLLLKLLLHPLLLLRLHQLLKPLHLLHPHLSHQQPLK